MKRLAIFAAIAVTSCAAGQQQFEPTERVQGRTLEGDKVAIYPLAVATGQVGEAKVWSRGAEKTEGGTVVRIGLDVHNTGSVPIELRPGEVTLEVVAGDHATIGGLRPIDEGARSFAPGQTDEASLVFPLPQGVSPGDVAALRVDWQLHVADQVYAQRTPFMEEREPVYPADPYGPHGYMYPYGYWDGYWGLGYGFGYSGPVYRGHLHGFGVHHGHGGHHDRGHGGHHNHGHGGHHGRGHSGASHHSSGHHGH